MPDSSQRIGFIQAGRSTGSDRFGYSATTTLTVDKANATDGPIIINAIAEAFLNDPTWSWAFPDPMARRKWWDFCINEALRYAWTFKTEGYEAVSV